MPLSFKEKMGAGFRCALVALLAVALCAGAAQAGSAAWLGDLGLYDSAPTYGDANVAGAAVDYDQPFDPTLASRTMAASPALPISGVASVSDAAYAVSGGSVIDVLVVYTGAAAGASGDIGGQAGLAIDLTNQALANSGVSARVNLVGVEEIAYAESGSGGTDLERLAGQGDGFLDAVHGLRDSLGADLVSLWVDNLDVAGMSYQLTDLSSSSLSFNAAGGFSVVDVEAATSNYTFTHELGHNLGANHDAYVAGDSGQAFSYSHGYADTQAGWYTIMSYADALLDSGWDWGGITRIPYFSNPDISYEGRATGDGAANNALTIEQTAAYVASYR